MLSLGIFGTVASMEQPFLERPVQKQDEVAHSNVAWGWNGLKENFNYYVASPVWSFGSAIGSRFSYKHDPIQQVQEDQETLQEPHQNNPVVEQKKVAKNEPTQQLPQTKQSSSSSEQQSQNKQSPLLKKPTRLYYIMGGSLFASTAAVAYKAVNYVQLSCVKRNLSLLDDLIAAANSTDQDKLNSLYEHKKDDLTLLVESEKGLLQHLLPEKTKFVETAKNIKLALPERVRSSIFTRISYGIKDDVKRAQGGWDRARNAIKQKLGKIFKGIK